MMPRVVIVGGGISGLATAYYLAKGGKLVPLPDGLMMMVPTPHRSGCDFPAYA